jgi:hypothetical protein
MVPGIFQDEEEIAVQIRAFEVVVRGRLSPALLAAFDGCGAAPVDGGFTRLTTHCDGRDALYGVFRLLRDLNIELVSVNPVIESPISSP